MTIDVVETTIADEEKKKERGERGERETHTDRRTAADLSAARS